MKAHFRSKNGRLVIEVQADDVKGLFKGIAGVQAAFDVDHCGKCGSEDIRYVVRKVRVGEYYELWCKQCNARLTFGQNKDGGTLFVKRGEVWAIYIDLPDHQHDNSDVPPGPEPPPRVY